MRFDQRWKDITKQELLSFIGIILFMGIYQLPNRGMYWEKGIFHSNFVHESMSESRFNFIFNNWHYEDISVLLQNERNAKTKESAFFQVDQFLEKLSSNFQRYFRCGQNVDIDETTIPYKGRHRYKFYNPNKPNKWHFKGYCLNDSETGYLYNFFMYKGRDENRPDN